MLSSSRRRIRQPYTGLFPISCDGIDQVAADVGEGAERPTGGQAGAAGLSGSRAYSKCELRHTRPVTRVTAPFSTRRYFCPRAARERSGGAELERDTFMTSIEGRADDADEASTEWKLKFVLTLIVTTVIVVFAVYVLGSAVLDGGASAHAHRAAIASMHAHS